MTGLVQLKKVEEVAELFQISPDRVRKRCKEGAWPYTPFDRNIRFTEDDLAKILALQKRDIAAPTSRPRRTHSRRRTNA
jgi:hypothetical protein